MYSHRSLRSTFSVASVFFCLVLGGGASSYAQTQPPVPIVKNLMVEATASFDSTASAYTYQYKVTSLPSNTGNVSGIDIDITTDRPISLSSIPHPVPEFRSAITKSLDKTGIKILPVSLTSPSGWFSTNLTAQGTASWGEMTKSTTLGPGQSLTGFALVAQFAPGIRTITITPAISTWNLYPNVDDPDEVQAERKALIKGLKYVGNTLGPVAVSGTYSLWDHLRDALNRAAQLGWIADTALANNLISQLASARQALDANDGTLAKKRLQALLVTLFQSTNSQRRQEAYDLIRLNTNALIVETPDTPIPFEPKLMLSPKVTELSIGARYTLTATMINLGDNKPIQQFSLQFTVAEGPHAGLSQDARTDSNGRVVFQYTGAKLGTDKIVVSQPLAFHKRGIQLAALGGVAWAALAQTVVEGIHDEARVTWNGGPDLVVPSFVPPLIESAGGKTIFLGDITSNIGTTPAGPSITRYYLTPTPPPLDPALMRVIAERSVPGLSPDESDRVDRRPLTLPADLPAGRYYLAACADADKTIVELDETNNCSFNRLSVSVSITVPLKVENLPPDCAKAKPSLAQLWPPNHRLVDVGIQGVTDPDADPVALRIVRITQDERVNGLGDGDTSPDGFGVGQAQARLRAERSGTGNGRVYVITFRADDGRGGTCTGTVSSGVPHDQGQGATPIDDGQKYDSTAT